MSAYPLENPKVFSRLVWQARKNWGYSQRELAHMAGVSQKFISEFESGKETVQLKQALMVCSALNLRILIEI
mgnify:CR=1 FL=1